MGLRWGKDDHNMAVLCNKTGLCNKEPWIGVLCNKSGHPTTVQRREGGSALISRDLTSDIFSLQISLCPHCLCRPSLTVHYALQCKDKEVCCIKCVETSKSSTRDNIFLFLHVIYLFVAFACFHLFVCFSFLECTLHCNILSCRETEW